MNKTVTVFCNRGTSGIDGSTSTAIGAAFMSKKRTTLISGDLSFFYDSNALWNDYIPTNFRIIIINNSGGGIFKIIPGPKKSNALKFFETPHCLTAQHLCKMHRLDYSKSYNIETLDKELADFYKESTQPKLLEIFTPSSQNDLVLKEYINSLK
jgi:2-succinyl-5-enolpyruvyl-6-hydroxy-3-cyclohexene-1-carboxylate synthase